MIVNEFRILLIDDDEDDYVQIRDLLGDISRSQYKLTWKPSYKEGLEALQTKEFDACLLDYRLGAQTGLELLREAYKLGSVCPMIFLTGHGDFDLDIQAMQVGASDYLVKGQLTAPLLERSIRYSMKHVMDMEELKESRLQILQQDRLASLGLLASSLAHEIGTPLGIIRSRAELAEKKSSEDKSVKQDMEVVVSQIDKITKLVNSLLHLARGQKSDQASAVNVKDAVQDVLNLMQHELDRKNIKLILNVDEPCIAKAEAGPLGQVILNLLVNSVHAIEEAIEKGRPAGHHIDISVHNESDKVKIRISDTGCGIPAENLSQLFKPFFTTKDIGYGTGLGLATSFKILRSWGGSIVVESQPLQGATFIIDLPKI